MRKRTFRLSIERIPRSNLNIAIVAVIDSGYIDVHEQCIDYAYLEMIDGVVIQAGDQDVM